MEGFARSHPQTQRSKPVPMGLAYPLPRAIQFQAAGGDIHDDGKAYFLGVMLTAHPSRPSGLSILPPLAGRVPGGAGDSPLR